MDNNSICKSSTLPLSDKVSKEATPLTNIHIVQKPRAVQIISRMVGTKHMDWVSMVETFKLKPCNAMCHYEVV